jgi:sugar lactone lactonase YvrE
MRLRVVLSILFVFLFHTWGYAATCEYQFETTWGSEGSGDGQLYYPEGVALDTSGNVYVADRVNHRIQKFTSDGTFLTTWGSKCDLFNGIGCVDPDGEGPLEPGDGQFKYPEGVAVDTSGNVYVADEGNHRIQKFTSDGTFLTKWGSNGSGNGQFSGPYGVAVDASGNVYVADIYNYRIQKFTSYGTFLTKWGSLGSGDGQFANPMGVAVDSSGNVYVADTWNHRIQKFRGYHTFFDVTSDFWADDYISSIYCAGITTGYDDGTYKPLREVNRAQMAIFIIRALYGDDFSYGSTPYFPDVLSGHWAFKYIQKLYEEGITTGYDDGTYKPLREVNRAQMAIFIIRALYGEDFSYGTTPYFPDVPSGHWAFKYVQKLYEEGITTGYDDGTYKPLTTVNRAQMAAFLARAFLRME